MVLHHYSVDSSLIWDKEPLCPSVPGVAAPWFILTVQFGRSHHKWMWGSGWRNTSGDGFRPCFICDTRVQASCLCFSASTREWILMDQIRELQGGGGKGSSSLLTLFEWTLDFQKRELLNSELSAVGTRQLFGGAGFKSRSTHHSGGFVVQ